jgi:chemotaxis signal transduction protein
MTDTFTHALGADGSRPADTRDALLVRIGRECVALWLDAVETQLDTLEVRPLPDWRAGVAGLLRTASGFVPLYLPEHTLGIVRDDAETLGGAVVLRVAGKRVALAIDEPLDVLPISAANLRQPPAAIAEDGLVQALTWADGRLIAVLDPRAVVQTCHGTHAPAGVNA